MINTHEKLVLVFIGMTSAFLAESCQGDRTQGQQFSSKNCEKYSRSALGVARYLRSYWDRRADVCCVLLRAPAQERGTYAAIHKYYHSNFSANKQNRDA
jgi:hypothetical protein